MAFQISKRPNIMKIVTWNINSIRIRLPLISDFISKFNPDIICFQETKTRNEFFPKEFFAKLGFTTIECHGEKSYNGVAIITKLPYKNLKCESFFNQDTRHMSMTLLNNIEIHNFYIPAGGDIVDVNLNKKFAHKLEYYDLITNHFKENYNPESKIIILGDLNTAPFEHDVWSHKQLINVISHTPIEVEKMLNLRDSIGFIDIGREFVPLDQKLYSWWSYRNKDWKKSNRGRRLDHIWCTQPLKKYIKDFFIAKEIRDCKNTSDHVPVIAEFDLDH